MRPGRWAKRFTAIQSILHRADARYANKERAFRIMSQLPRRVQERLMELSVSDRFSAISDARTLATYSETHAILKYFCRRLKGKRLLHLGGAAGVYTRYLQDLGVKAYNLEIRQKALVDARHWGNRRGIRGSAVPNPRAEIGYASTHLPFRDNSMDVIVSDHFLFANYHREYFYDRGFEESPGSIHLSEKALHELNRILRINGIVIVTSAHSGEVDTDHYREGYTTTGFVVEKTFGDELKPFTDPNGPLHFVLRKVKDL